MAAEVATAELAKALTNDVCGTSRRRLKNRLKGIPGLLTDINWTPPAEKPMDRTD